MHYKFLVYVFLQKQKRKKLLKKVSNKLNSKNFLLISNKNGQYFLGLSLNRLKIDSKKINTQRDNLCALVGK